MFKKLKQSIVRFFTEIFEETYVEMYVDKRLSDIIEVGEKCPKSTHHAVSWAAHFKQQMKKRNNSLYFIVTGDDVEYFKILLSSEPFRLMVNEYNSNYTDNAYHDVKELDASDLPGIPDKVNAEEIKRIFTHKREKRRVCGY